MIKLLLTFIFGLACCFFPALADTAHPQDSLLMVFEIARYGAKNGLGIDVFQTQWQQGEVNNMGKRQHYLAGEQLRQHYINNMKFLSSNYSSNEILIKAANTNKSIESAISQLLGLYPAEANVKSLESNQTLNATPQFNVSQEMLSLIQNELQHNPVPFNEEAFYIQTVDKSHDTFLPYQTCQTLVNQKRNRTQWDMMKTYLDLKYNDTIHQVATLLNLTDNKNFSSVDVVKYADSLYARYFLKLDMGSFNSSLIEDVFKLAFDYHNYTYSVNATVEKIIRTGILSKMITNFNYKTLNPHDPLKFYAYFEESEVILHLTNLFKYQFPQKYIPYATQMLIEFHHVPSTNSHYVNVSINGETINLPGPCGNQNTCEFYSFQDLVKDGSYVGDANTYSKLCGLTPEEAHFNKMEKWQQTLGQGKIVKQKKNQVMRILELYAVMMLLVIVGWIIYAIFRYKDVDPYEHHAVELTQK